MESQTKSLADSVKVAQDSVAATNRNIEQEVQRDRARIFVELEPFNISKLGLMTNIIEYKIIFHGSTFAFIQDTAADCELTDSKEPPKSSYIGGLVVIPKVIPPNTPEQRCTTPLFHVFDDFEKDSITHQKSFIHFRGYIKYKDFVGNNRETTFSYVWIPKPLGMAIGWAHWEKTGPPEANHET